MNAERLEETAMALTIGQVATAGGVNVETIRYYERRGLFPLAGRTPSGYRQYADEAITRLRFIKHAQELGFSLEDIRELLALRVRNGGSCRAVAHKTRAKIAVVEERIRHLQRMKRTLELLAAACAARRLTEECPILETLEDHAVAR
ncbi:MAG: MerR family DNA-binding protein [Gemmatimonadaceae bacterium]